MHFKMILTFFIILSLSVLQSQAQDRWQWPEHPLNIKVLPSDLTADQLRDAMREFSSSLGVRCNYCHVGEEGKPFSVWDFAADDNPNKKRAREMILMIYDIDEHLYNIEPSGDQRVNVSCYTCHRGRPRPMSLGEEIGEVYRKDGLEPAIMHISQLKKDFYGKGMYNFEDDQVLGTFGRSLLDSSKTDEALRIFQLNIEYFPESSNAWSDLAQGYMKSGNNAEAKKSLEKAMELDPRNRRAKRMLQELEEQQ